MNAMRLLIREGFQLAEGYEFVNILSGTTHEYGCFGKGEILLMLYLHDWPGGFEEVVLLFRSGSFGFCLTSLAAIFLYPAPVTNDLPQNCIFWLFSCCFIVYWFIPSIVYLWKR